MLQMHQPFCEYGDAESLSPQYTTHISDQSIAIHFARQNVEPNTEVRYNHSKLERKKKNRARIVILVTRAVALLVLPKRCSLIQIFTAYHCVPKNCPKISLKRNTRIFFRIFVMLDSGYPVVI